MLKGEQDFETLGMSTIQDKLARLEKRLSDSEHLIDENLDESQLSKAEIRELDAQLSALEAEIRREESQHLDLDVGKRGNTAEVAALANRLRTLEKQVNTDSEENWKRKLRRIIAFMGSTSAIFGFCSIFFPELRQIVHTSISGAAGLLVAFFAGKKT